MTFALRSAQMHVRGAEKINTVISAAVRRPNCGVSRYAELLEIELAKLGESVLRVDVMRGPIPNLKSSRVLINLEIGEDLKHTQVLKHLRMLLRGENRASKPVIIAHSVFRAEDIHKPSWYIGVALAIQRCFYRWAVKRATLVVLSEAARSVLANRGVSASFIPFGSYSSEVPDVNPVARRYDERVAFGLIGHPYRSKRYDLAIRALLDLPEETRRRVVLRFIGGDPAVDPDYWTTLMGVDIASSLSVEVTGPLGDADYQTALKTIEIGLLPYGDRTSGSAATADLLGVGAALIVSEATMFDNLVSDGVAIRTLWPTEATVVINELMANPSGVIEARLASAKYARANSMTNTARRVLAALNA